MLVRIIEDELTLSEGLRMALSDEGYSVEAARSLEEAEVLASEAEADVILLDVKLPDGNGLDYLSLLLRRTPEAKVIVMTAFGDSPTVVRAIQEGAYNFLDKPFPLEAVLHMVARAAESLALERRVRHLSDSQAVPFIGDSPAMTAVRAFVEKVAPHENVNILVTGESGVGKDVVARAIHGRSGARGDFVTLNCPAVPEGLVEAELFGYRKGAYTGAAEAKLGLVEMADGGTLFLDEIGDMPLSLQGKLLRFLDSRSLRPLGGTKERTVALRVICATCADLKERCAAGRFRKDLFYRISMLPLEIPPLRERGQDVLLLAAYWLRQLSGNRRNAPLALSPEVEDLFLAHPWPGNVRQLKNLLERVLILKEGGAVVSLKDLPQDFVDGGFGGGPKNTSCDGGLPQRLEVLEREAIRSALARFSGNRTKAAESLGISRYALLRRLQSYGEDL